MGHDDPSATKEDLPLLTFEKACQLRPDNPDDMWNIVKRTCDPHEVHLEPSKQRRGWKTIRIFVSSTFRDFHQEREVLVKEVFPDLRLWCEERKLRLVECDLRWGVPKDATTEETIRICLEELDRCYEDNTSPFFLNLAGHRAGWIPGNEDLNLNLAAQYGWIYGLSVTEMEIVHGAFRKVNPNALFMIRAGESLKGIPKEFKDDFIDATSLGLKKVDKLKEMISSTFPGQNVYTYKITPRSSAGAVHFDGLSGESDFSQTVYDFFKKRIEELYPLDPSPEDPLQKQREAHETFMDSRSQSVLGRDKILEEIQSYIRAESTGAPLLIVGEAGAGKSAVSAKAAYDTVQAANQGSIPFPTNVDENSKWKVFFHFVGATPGSTDLAFFLQRLTKEVKPDLHETLSDLESLIQLSGSLLSNPNTEPVIIFVDAVNQMDEDKQQFLSRWLPEELSPNVRVVVSMIEGTPTHTMLRAYKTMPKEIICGPLDAESREAIVKNILSQYNKRLDQAQMEAFVAKEGSSNPLWLTLACEELRVFGDFMTILDKIQQLPDDLISLETEVFSRFENEPGGKLMVATLCLLEVSRHGLLETELLAILGEETNVSVPEFKEGEEEEIIAKSESVVQQENPETSIDKVTLSVAQKAEEAYVVKDKTKEKEETKRRPKGKQIKFLPAREWAVIYRNLKPLLRPCGDLGEGRLDFYHRSLSKAVRKKYFSGSEAYVKHFYNYWHGVLAGYFEGVDDMDRKAEELPYHLEKLLDNNRLVRCLLEWPVFDRLFSEDFSVDLLHSWQKAGGYAVAAAMYKEAIKVLKTSGMSLVDYGDEIEKVIMFLIQAGQYTDALEILEERRTIEEEELGSRPGEMADIYELMSKCKSEIVKNYQFVTMAQYEEDLEVIDYCKKALAYRKQLGGEENEVIPGHGNPQKRWTMFGGYLFRYRCVKCQTFHQFKAAMINVVLVHHLSIVADLKTDDDIREEAFAACDEAINYFEKINDIGHMAEAIMTKSFIHPRDAQYFDEKLAQLKQADDLRMKAYGDKHLLAVRMLLNIGILYEDNGDYERAYDYFVKWHDACIKVLGPSHPKTKRAKDCLDEQVYKNIKQTRERQAAGTA